jgi:hypothetical protein
MAKRSRVERPRLVFRVPAGVRLDGWQDRLLPMAFGESLTNIVMATHGDAEALARPLVPGSSIVLVERPLLSGGEDDDNRGTNDGGGVALFSASAPLPADLPHLRLPYGTFCRACIPHAPELDPLQLFMQSPAAAASSASWRPGISLAAVVLLVAPDGSVLITQRMNRRRGTYTNLWVLPGGHVDPGETIRGAAAREALEVSGLRRWMAEAAGVEWAMGHAVRVCVCASVCGWSCTSSEGGGGVVHCFCTCVNRIHCKCMNLTDPLLPPRLPPSTRKRALRCRRIV